MTADRLAPFRYLRSHFRGRGEVTSAMLKEHYAHAKETFMATQGIVAMNASHLGAFLSYLQATYPLPAQTGGDGFLASLGLSGSNEQKPAAGPEEQQKPAAGPEEQQRPAASPEEQQRPAAGPEEQQPANKPAEQPPKADRLEEQHRELSARLDRMSEDISSRFADLRETLGKILAKLEDVVVVEE